MDGVRVYKRLLTYVKPYWKAFIVAVIGMLIVAGTEVGFAAIMRPMLDGTFVKKDPFYLTFIPIALIGIFIIRGIGSFCVGYCITWIGRYVIKDLRREMFASIVNLPTRFYDAQSPGRLLSKLIFDVDQVSAASSGAITVFIQDSLTLIGLLFWLLYLNWKLALLFLILGPVLSVMVVVVNKRVRIISHRLQQSMGSVSQVAQESIDGQKVVKIFGGQEYEQQRFEEANEHTRHQVMKLTATNATSVPIVQLAAATLLALIVYLATRPDMQNAITVGTFMSFITAVLLLFPPLKRLTTVNATIQQGITAANSVFTLLEEATEENNGTRTLEQVQGEVVFKNVSFAYDNNQPVLEDINVEIRAGETVAFVGRSGSGKTTLVSLIPRFYSPLNGEITVDGINLKELELNSLRKSISLVSQDITLFNDTLAHNIAYGNLGEVSEEHIIEAAKAAYAWEFIKDLPKGLNTLAGEKGMMFSGGQRQRLAIARAILKDAPILILDEATSALDSESEKHIQKALEKLMVGRTTLVIAHRLSTIENADKIVVMDSGKIVECGTHSELMAKNGHYAMLHAIQFGNEH